ncbi:MAG: thioredoxin domain-containing protein, partial [Ignavibacteriae bacterium]|nr:thioredoxin domain-containing protein [Ignavibacteriota bacterium]
AVLKSNYANIFKGNLSLGLLGFSYFFATFNYLIFNNFYSTTMSMLAITSFLTIPAIIISLYYQAFVIKQWCKFCIVIQIVLILEVIISSIGGLYNSTLDLYSLPLYIMLFFIPILSWKLIKPIIEQQKENVFFKIGFKRIKSNPILFKSLLLKSNKIKNNTDGLGISIINEKSKYDVIKVCNPYCGPCAKAHPILEELLKAGIINLQILFNATTSEKDFQAKPVKHFLAIDAQYNKEETLHALDNWYNADKKDYEEFAKNHVIIGDLKEQDEKVKAMGEWCSTQNITHTPTIFINGNELPNEYSIEDLKEMLIVNEQNIFEIC